MSYKILLALFALGLLTTGIVAASQPAPGYMDADYYFAGSLQLAQGAGLWEPFIWNYLDNPQGIPHPSHAYWMPLASFVGLFGLALSEARSFSAAQLGFILIAGLVPPLTAILAYEMEKTSWNAMLSGTLAAFSVFFLPFIATTDTFGIYMLLGALFFLVFRRIAVKARSGEPIEIRWITFAICGAVVGLMHLARADGFLWLFIALFGAFLLFSLDIKRNRANLARGCILIVFGYLLIMGPWLARNLAQFGTPISAAGGRTLWLPDYNAFFSYPPSALNPADWWRRGLSSILGARLWAVQTNLQRALAEQGMIFLAPFILLGLWKLRGNFIVRLGVFAWILTFAVMTILFPFSGARGGFFHSAAAIQPLFWAAAPIGLDQILHWGVEKRDWELKRARAMFGSAAVGLAMILSVYVITARVLDTPLNSDPWGKSEAIYHQLDDALNAAGIEQSEIGMINNPPGYFVATGRPAIVIPDGDVTISEAAAERYHASYLILEVNHPAGWEQTYQHPHDLPGWQYLMTVSGAHIFRFTQNN